MNVEETISLVEGLARVMREYRLDAVHVGDVKIVKTHHEPLPAQSGRGTPSPPEDDEDAALFHSS